MKLSTRLLFALLTLLPLASTMAATYAGQALHTEKQQRHTLALSTARATPPTEGLASLSVYPNPARGQVTVQLTQRAGQDYKLRLSNIIGKEIKLVALRPELTEAGQVLDLRDLPTGMYFYSLLLNDKVLTTKRLVLQN